MAERIAWDKYEAAILLDAVFRIEANAESKKTAVVILCMCISNCLKTDVRVSKLFYFSRQISFDGIARVFKLQDMSSIRHTLWYNDTPCTKRIFSD